MAQVKYGCHAVVKFRAQRKRESLMIIGKAEEYCRRRGVGLIADESTLYPGAITIKLQSIKNDMLLVNFHVVYTTVKSLIGYIKRFKTVEIVDQEIS